MKPGWIIGGAALATGLFGWLSSKALAAEVPLPLPAPPPPPPVPIPTPRPRPPVNTTPPDQPLPFTAEEIWAAEAMSADYLNVTCRIWSALSLPEKQILMTRLEKMIGTTRRQPWIINDAFEASTLTRPVSGYANIGYMIAAIDEFCANSTVAETDLHAN